MAVSPRILRRRLKSLKSTRKIMKAMELVAASKMRKTMQQTLATRPYAAAIETLTQDVRRVVDPQGYPLLVGQPKSARKTLLVVASSDRGLCGGFNSQLLRAATLFMKQRKEEVVIMTIGRRADQALRRAGHSLLASFEALSNAPTFERSLPMARLVLDTFTSGQVDGVFFAFTEFKSALIQTPKVKQLLPIVPEAELATMSVSTSFDRVKRESTTLLEPNPDILLQRLLPRMVEMQIYQALLESAASEHAARMMAMKSAGDAAEDVQSSVTLSLNRARQAVITREISEIAAGKAALDPRL